jgi:hypothetical protein
MLNASIFLSGILSRSESALVSGMAELAIPLLNLGAEGYLFSAFVKRKNVPIIKQTTRA